jgi:hypothetical protein
MPNTGNSSLARRIGALEAKNPAGPDWDKLTAEELRRLLYLNYMRWFNGLDDDALAEANRLNTALGLPPSDLRGPIDSELPPENQENINWLAGDDPHFRQWATKKTWTDCFYTVAVPSESRRSLEIGYGSSAEARHGDQLHTVERNLSLLHAGQGLPRHAQLLRGGRLDQPGRLPCCARTGAHQGLDVHSLTHAG